MMETEGIVYDNISVPKHAPWLSWMDDNGAIAQFQLSNSSIQVAILESTGSPLSIVLGRGAVSLLKHHSYLLSLDVSVSKPGVLTFSCYKQSGDWKERPNPTEAILVMQSSGTHHVETSFTATTSLSTAWCTIGLGALEPGTELILSHIQLGESRL